MIGELYKFYYSKTRKQDPNNVLKDIENLYFINGYPRKLIISKISGLKERNFKPSKSRALRGEEIKNKPDRNCIISLTYTSHSCESIA